MFKKVVLNFFQIILVISLPAFAMAKTMDSMPAKIDCFKEAYDKYIRSVEVDRKNKRIYFHMIDGHEILWDDERKKSFAEKLESPDLIDTLSLPYPSGRDLTISPRYEEDPGRFRNQEFLQSIYGDDKKTIEKNLIKISWLPSSNKNSIYLFFNKQNGAAHALELVSQELDKLPQKYKKYLTNASSYEWRLIAHTNYLSAHAYGIAIDLDTPYSNYWLWDIKGNDDKDIHYQNKIPQEIIKIFERHKFIWGGRWFHYDTMHFEYRPEFFSSICLIRSHSQ